MKALSLLLLFGIASLLLSPTTALADGKVFGGKDYHSLELVREKEQVAAISHRDDIEKMVIAINFEMEESEKALWIFPVPGAPDRTTVDVVDSFPQFGGSDPAGKVAELMFVYTFLARATQIFPLLAEIPILPALAVAGDPAGGISVYEETERWGIHIEAITAQSTEALSEYLKKKKTQIPSEELTVFEPYLSEEYVLIVAWINSTEDLLKEFPQYGENRYMGFRERWPCLYVEFPTEKPFYPMRPTRSYGKHKVPVRLILNGCMKPETDSALTRQLEVSHYIQRGFPESWPAKFAEDFPKRPFIYTLIRCNMPAEEFTEDLWFSRAPLPALRIKLALLLVRLGDSRLAIPGFFAFVALLSYLSAGISGLLLFGRWKNYARFGLWNVFTLLGLSAAIHFHRGELAQSLRDGVWRFHCKLDFTDFFMLIFVLLTMVAYVIVPFLFGLEWEYFHKGPLVAPLIFVSCWTMVVIAKAVYHHIKGSR